MKQKIKKTKKKVSQSMAIAALLLNVLLMPGLGTIIAGRTSEGLLQIILLVVGIALSFFLIGIPIVILVWIWGLVTGVQLIKEAEQ
ncbi:hypothetical protein EXS74_00080 [Candidatus Woesearchaeota archaeon]|nr:hypothetical protein [Candidatus Woesearchaeota archaeon]